MRLIKTKISLFIGANKISFYKFFFTGSITFTLNYFLVWLFFDFFHLDYKKSISFAYLVVVFFHFFLNRHFTFSSDRKFLGIKKNFFIHVIKYLSMLIINYSVTMLFAFFVVQILHKSPYLSIFVSTCFTSILSYLLMKYFIFYKG
jgi:putative flippase GtrA